MGFRNSIVGAGGTLLRAAIRSLNYVAGVSGWTVNNDGTAEFQSGTFRGNVTASQLIAGQQGVTTYVSVDSSHGVKFLGVNGAIIYDLTTNQCIFNNPVSVNNLIVMQPRTTAPSNPGAWSIYSADGVGWDPLTRANGKPYLVYYDSTAWKAVSAP